ncbi:carbohydrate ABC transporter permease [Halalkalibacter alkalisediminis]|uniref:Carbohydrate ABC transporter permease n=1 Tax=Halalkalibacter alkalisediminis TaxID=935616 RepID=A0ABV6NEM8_9BACI|nr:sugar ABC transporter permease [Halalkalibacter alkalisediminis]
MVKSIKATLSKQKWREAISGYLFFLPALILLSLFLLYPMGMAFYYSFTDFYLLTPGQKNFVGFDNFLYAFQDSEFRLAFKNTLYFVIVIVPIQTAVGLGLAILVNKKLRMTTFFRTAYFSPVVMSLVVVSILWTFLYNPNDGLFNQILVSLGFSPQPFLTSADQAMNSIIAMSVWQGAGFQMLIFLAGLQTIPAALYEAASIDGANSWRKFLNITLPGLKNVSIFIVITITIAAFKLLIQPMIMTQGGPLGSTKSLVHYTYQVGFAYRDVGYASALAVLFTVIVLVISLTQRKLLTEDRG